MTTQHPDDVPTLDFASLQVRDLNAARTFYEGVLGFAVAQQTPGAVIFQNAHGASFAVRTPLVDLDAVSMLGHGVGLWFTCPDVTALQQRLAERGVEIVQPPRPSPFGTTLVVRDPDGYALTFHEAAQGPQGG